MAICTVRLNRNCIRFLRSRIFSRRSISRSRIFTAIFCASVEFFGGILFALGLGTRIISLMLFVNMTTAYWTADREAFLTLFSSDPDKFLKADYPTTFWFAAHRSFSSSGRERGRWIRSLAAWAEVEHSSAEINFLYRLRRMRGV